MKHTCKRTFINAYKESVVLQVKGIQQLYVKGKAVQLQAWSGPEGSRKLRFPDFLTTAQNGGKVVSLTHRPHLPPGNNSWCSFLLEAESTPGPQGDRNDYVNGKIQ
jgi:hypothetical protein